jgi:P27 family predicted phage terminase small subunit
MGRKMKPTALKLLQGTARAHRLNPAEPMPNVGEPEPLETLTPAALLHFRNLTGTLSAVRVLTVNDGAGLSLLAQALATYEECNRGLAMDGLVVQTERGPARSPWAILQKQAWEQIQRGLADFGLTPASRSKIVAAPAPPKDDGEALFG